MLHSRMVVGGRVLAMHRTRSVRARCVDMQHGECEQHGDKTTDHALQSRWPGNQKEWSLSPVP